MDVRSPIEAWLTHGVDPMRLLMAPALALAVGWFVAYRGGRRSAVSAMTVRTAALALCACGLELASYDARAATPYVDALAVAVGVWLVRLGPPGCDTPHCSEGSAIMAAAPDGSRGAADPAVGGSTPAFRWAASVAAGLVPVGLLVLRLGWKHGGALANAAALAYLTAHSVLLGCWSARAHTIPRGRSTVAQAWVVGATGGLAVGLGCEGFGSAHALTLSIVCGIVLGVYGWAAKTWTR